MPTAVERAGIGVKAIIAVLEEHRGEPPSEVGKEFGGAISEFNFALPAVQHLGGLLVPAVHALLPAVQHVELLGITPPDHDHGVF